MFCCFLYPKYKVRTDGHHFQISSNCYEVGWLARPCAEQTLELGRYHSPSLGGIAPTIAGRRAVPYGWSSSWSPPGKGNVGKGEGAPDPKRMHHHALTSWRRQSGENIEGKQKRGGRKTHTVTSMLKASSSHLQHQPPHNNARNQPTSPTESVCSSSHATSEGAPQRVGTVTSSRFSIEEK